MSEQVWERKEYSSWDEAFRGLAPVIRQQSVRVAAYTQVLFIQACVSNYGTNTPEGAERIKGEHADLAYKCGLYHQLGKALVPTEYQVWNPNFTDEEKALYRKYTSDGRLLVAKLQDPATGGVFGKKRSEDAEPPTKKVTWLMLREACEQHMERFNGSGYPDSRVGNEISVIAQIVGLAKELDRLASETKLENPFDEAYVKLVDQAGKEFSEELIEVLKAARGKCRGVYKKYIQYTKTLPMTIPLVDQRKDRPMGLMYRPMIKTVYEVPVAYEAVPWFGGVLGQPDATESLKELEERFIRTKMIDQITYYFLYEAADTVLRLQNCEIKTEGVLVPVMEGFYSEDNKLYKLQELFADQPIDNSKLMLTVPENAIINGVVKAKENLIEYIENGIQLVLDDYHPDRLSLNEIREIGFSKVRFSPEVYGSQEIANIMTIFKNKGITIIGAGADNTETLSWLNKSGVEYSSGTLSGVLVTEDDIIRDRLSGDR